METLHYNNFQEIFKYLTQMELSNILLVNKQIYDNTMRYINETEFEKVSDEHHLSIIIATEQIISLKKYHMNICLKHINAGFGIACQIGNVPILKYMIECGANNWELGLQNACIGKHMNIVNMMIEEGAEDYDEALRGACIGGDLEIVKLMMINQNRFMNNRCLVGACMSGNLDLVKYFIKKGGNDWNACLYTACKSKYMHIVKFIIKKGADNWDLGLMGACERTDNIGVIKLMIDNGAEELEDAFITACEKSDEDTIDYLIGATELVIDEDLLNAGLMAAIKHENYDVVKPLVDYGADCYNEALVKASKRFNNIDVLKYLIEKGADDFNNALSEACARDNTETVKYLVKNGATTCYNCHKPMNQH